MADSLSAIVMFSRAGRAPDGQGGTRAGSRCS